MMDKIVVINTGGTFNKRYNPRTGELEVDATGSALKTLSKRWMQHFEIVNIIHKDSLDMTNDDRLELLATIQHSVYHKILIVHGTDTMDITATYLDHAETNKQIVLTGAMVPFSIDPIEATANFSTAYTALTQMQENHIYIAMNGRIGPYQTIKKERTKGHFVQITP